MKLVKVTSKRQKVLTTNTFDISKTVENSGNIYTDNIAGYFSSNSKLQGVPYK